MASARLLNTVTSISWPELVTLSLIFSMSMQR
jgi:hypothetical protein